MKTIVLENHIPENLAGMRLDQALAAIFFDYSRSQIQAWIKAGQVLVDGQAITRPKEKVVADQHIEIKAELEAKENWEAQSIPLEVVYEDDSLIIINKPAGLTVHPGAGVRDQTLVNALLYRFPELDVLPRAGLIHRLDKDTSGLLVVARNLSAHHYLVQAMQERQITRKYEAVVAGVLISGGTIDQPIGRHPQHRTRMEVMEDGRPAVTHYRIIKRYRIYTHLSIQLETGRTHQIRVHMAHIGYPIVGDGTYNRRRNPTLTLKRQALHASELELVHPKTKELMHWKVELPADMQELIQELVKDLNEKK